MIFGSTPAIPQLTIRPSGFRFRFLRFLQRHHHHAAAPPQSRCIPCCHRSILPKCRLQLCQALHRCLRTPVIILG